MIVREQAFSDGLILQADVTDASTALYVSSLVRDHACLIVADPPYGRVVSETWDNVSEDASRFADWMVQWTVLWSTLLENNGAFYVWGGTGRPGFRPFYLYVDRIERHGLLVANHITWRKKRGYGIQHNYLYVREELLYLIKGDNVKKPRCFHVPLLDEKRGKVMQATRKDGTPYTAHSEFLRRTNVWDETEVWSRKLHVCQKADRVSEIPIEVHTNQGELVIDLFAGSGSTSAAARRTGRLWIAVENDPRCFDGICQRMRDEQA